MSSWLGNIFGWGSATTEPRDSGSPRASSAAPAQGRMGERVSVEQVEGASQLRARSASFGSARSSSGEHHSIMEESGGGNTWKEALSENITLENLSDFSDKEHLELLGQSDGSILYNTGHLREKPSQFQKIRSAMNRTQDQREIYRRGIANVRGMLLEKYDHIAVERFDKHFAYRVWAGKPLTVRALKVFIDEEAKLRGGSVDIDKVMSHNERQSKLSKAFTLEDVERRVNNAATTDGQITDRNIIGAEKKEIATFDQLKTTYGTYLSLGSAIVTSYWTSRSEKEARDRLHREGIEEARKAVKAAITEPLKDQPEEITRIMSLFDTKFSDKIKKCEPLKVKELDSFLDEAIEARKVATEWLASFESAAQQGEDKLVQKMGEFVTWAKTEEESLVAKTSYVLGAAILVRSTVNASDPIALAAKTAIIGGTLAALSPMQRLFAEIAVISS